MEAHYNDLEYHRTDCRKTLLVKILFAENLILGVSTARSSACNSESKAAIHNPSDRSSTSTIGFSFSPLVLRNYERLNFGRHLLDKKGSAKLRLYGFLPWLVSDLYGSDVTVQATNWLADGRAPRLMRYALTALSSFLTSNIGSRSSIIYAIKAQYLVPLYQFSDPVATQDRELTP